MGAQPSSPKGGRSAIKGRRSLHQIDEPSGITVEVPSSPAGRGGMSLQSLGSVHAAPFARALEFTDTPPRRCTPAWASPQPQAYGSSSSQSFSGDLEAGPTHLEGGTADIEVIHAVSEPMRRPSKMSVESFESELEASRWEDMGHIDFPGAFDTAASQADLLPDSRPSSSRGFGSSRPSSSVGGSRPASARSKLGGLRRMSMGELGPLPRDPSLVHAEKMARLTLEKLQQEDFITGREAWGASTPSTASPASISRATSSVSSGSRPTSSAASVSSSCFSTSSPQGEEFDAKQRLKDAQKRAKASMKALQSELKGSASATPARYSAWPSGCAVRVALSEQDSLIATLLHYSSSSNSFEVRLEDGSTRIVSAESVTRARVRDRTVQPQSAGQSPSSGGVHSGLGASGYQAPLPQSQRTQMNRPMSVQPSLAENFPFQPEPQMLGQTHMMS